VTDDAEIGWCYIVINIFILIRQRYSLSCCVNDATGTKFKFRDSSFSGS